MTLTINQRNFSSGIIDESFLGRLNTNLYANGVKTCENFIITPDGGIKKRLGLQYKTTLPDNCQILNLEFVAKYNRIAILYDNRTNNAGLIIMDIQGNNRQTIELNNLANKFYAFQFTETAFGVLVTHPDTPMQKFLYNATTGQFTFEPFDFYIGANQLTGMPFVSFPNSAVALTPSALSGNNISLSSNIDYFTANHYKTEFRLNGGQFYVTGYVTARLVTGFTLAPFTSTTATTIFTEGAFSPKNGYPLTVASYQGRLLIGGSRSFPNRIFASKIGIPYNFTLGVNDNDGFDFTLNGRGNEKIVKIQVNTFPEIYTNFGEWSIPSNDFTPNNLLVQPGRDLGVDDSQKITPAEGSTIMITNNNQDITRRSWVQINNTFQYDILNFASKDISTQCQKIIYVSGLKYLLAITNDNKLLAISYYTNQQIFGFTLFTLPAGQILDIAPYNNSFCVVVRVLNQNILLYYNIETECFADFWQEQTLNATPTLDAIYRNQQSVIMRVDDGAYQTITTPANGVINNPFANQNTRLGMAYSAICAPLPHFEQPVSMNNATAFRVHKVGFLTHKTKLLLCKILNNYYLRRLDGGLTPNAEPYNGWHEIPLLGWHHNAQNEIWRIDHNHPNDCQILAIKEYVTINQRS